MDAKTARQLKMLAGRVVVGVDTLDDSVELDVGDSEGWRLLISAAVDESGGPMLTAEWKPGLRRFHASVWSERMAARGHKAQGRGRRFARRAGFPV